MSFKIYNEDFEVGQKYRGMVNGEILTVVDVRVPGVDYPMMAPSGTLYIDRVQEKTIYFEDSSGRVSKSGLETAKRLMLERIDEPMAGFEKVYGLVEKARLASPVDTVALDDIRDTYGDDLYREALTAVLANHPEAVHREDMLTDIRFVMVKYVEGNSYGDLRLVEQDGARFVLDHNGKQAVVEFDLDCDDYVYTVNGKGPFEHHSYEFIQGDIMDVLEMEEKSLAERLVAFCQRNDFYEYMDSLEVGQTEEDVIAALEEELTDDKAAAAILDSLLEFKEEGPVDEEEMVFLDALIQDVRDVKDGAGKALGDVLEGGRISFDDLGLCIRGLKDGFVGHSNNFYRNLLTEAGMDKGVDDRLAEAVRRSEIVERETLKIDILQIMQGEDYRDFRFEPLRRVKGGVDGVSPENYNQVYSYSDVWFGSLGDSDGVMELLEDVFAKFNLRHPEDFRGHSLSVSDVVVLTKGSTARAYYCDSFGFKELPDDFVKAFQASFDRTHERDFS